MYKPVYESIIDIRLKNINLFEVPQRKEAIHKIKTEQQQHCNDIFYF